MFEINVILLSLALLIFFAYRGFSVLVLAPLLAMFAVLMTNEDLLLAEYTQIFMVKLGSFVTVYFPMFLLSAIFGKAMESSGYAISIAEYISKKIGAERSILAVILSCSVLTYGGVSLFVVVFTVYPIAVELLKKSNTPKRLIPAAIAVGSFTYTMVSLPGSPAIQNIIPSQYFGTNAFAAPGIGIIAAVFSFVLSMLWMNSQVKKAQKSNEGYGNHDDGVLSGSEKNSPNFWVAIIPVLIVIIVNYICIQYIFPNIDTSYLSDKKYGSISIKAVAGNWAIIVALFLALAFILIANYRKIDIEKCINNGAIDSLAPIFNTASVVGYGAVINNLAGFGMVRDLILSVSSGNPVISSAIATGVLSGITGSASGGMTIALDTLGAKYLEMANALTINPEVLHRIVSISSASIDILPHCGAVISLLAICKLTHKESYKDIFIGALLPGLAATIIAIIISLMFGAF